MIHSRESSFGDPRAEYDREARGDTSAWALRVLDRRFPAVVDILVNERSIGLQVEHSKPLLEPFVRALRPSAEDRAVADEVHSTELDMIPLMKVAGKGQPDVLPYAGCVLSTPLLPQPNTSWLPMQW